MTNKKGQAFLDQAIYPIYLLFVVLFLVVMGLVFVNFNSIFGTSEFSSNTDIQDLRTDALDTVGGFDIAIIILVVGFAVVIFLSAFFFNNAPFFFGIFLMLTFIFMLISFPLINGIYDFVNGTSMAVTISLMPATNFFINNWVWVIVAYVSSAIVGFGAKSKLEEGGGASL